MRCRGKWRPLAGVISLAAAACEPTALLPLDPIDAGSVIVVASTGDDGQLDRVDWHPVRDPDDLPALFTAAEQPLYTWVIPAGSFVHSDGAPWTIDALETIGTRLADRAPEPSGPGGIDGCGATSPSFVRCLAPSYDPPQIVFAGDSCPIPSWARGQKLIRSGDRYVAEESADLGSVAQNVIFDAPGTCACPMNDLGSASELEIEAIAPVGSPWPIEQLLQADDGSAIALSARQAVLLRPGAPPVTFDPGIVGRLSAAEMTASNTVLASASLLAGRDDFSKIVISLDDFDRPESEIDRVATYGIYNSRRAGAFPVFLFGSKRSEFFFDTPEIRACDATAGNCQLHNLRCDQEEFGVRGGTLTESGVGVALGTQGSIFFTKPEDFGEWECRIPRAYPIAGAPRSLQVRDLASVDAIGDRVFICGKVSDGASAILTAEVLTSTTQALNPNWVVVHRGQSCQPFHRTFGAPDRIHMLDSSAQSIVTFDQNGNTIGPSTTAPALSEIPFPITRIASRTGEHTIVATAFNAIFRRTRDGPFEQIYGPPRYLDEGYAVIGAGRERFLAFGLNERAYTITPEPSGGPTQLAEVPLPEPLAATGPTAAAEADPEAGTWYVSGVDQPADGVFVPWLRRVTLIGDRIGTIEDIELPPGLSRGRPTLLAATGVDRAILATLEGDVIEIDDTQTRALRVSFDDPLTEPIEVAPEPLVWRAIDSSAGVAWLVGYESLVARVGGGRVERISVDDRENEVDTKQLRVDAVRAFCPDQVYIGAFDEMERARPGFVPFFIRGLEVEGSSRGTIARLLPISDYDDVNATFARSSIVTYLSGTGGPTALRTNDPLTGGFSVAFGLHDMKRTFLPFPALEAVQGPREVTVVGGLLGQLATIKPRR